MKANAMIKKMTDRAVKIFLYPFIKFNMEWKTPYCQDLKNDRSNMGWVSNILILIVSVFYGHILEFALFKKSA